MLSLSKIFNRFISYMVSLGDRTPGYLFSVFLILLELILRTALDIDTKGFIGPTLAAAGIGMTIPITSYTNRQAVLSEIEKISTEFKRTILDKGYSLDTRRARVLRNIGWGMLILLSILWIVSIYTSIQETLFSPFMIRVQYVLGVICFIGGILITEVKEVIDGNNI